MGLVHPPKEVKSFAEVWPLGLTLHMINESKLPKKEQQKVKRYLLPQRDISTPRCCTSSDLLPFGGGGANTDLGRRVIIGDVGRQVDTFVGIEHLVEGVDGRRQPGDVSLNIFPVLRILNNDPKKTIGLRNLYKKGNSIPTINTLLCYWRACRSSYSGLGMH